MARPRKSNSHLPPGVEIHHGAYRYRGTATGGKPVRLCALTDGEHTMFRALATLTNGSHLVGNSFAYWIEAYKGNVPGIKASPQWKAYVQSTRDEYERMFPKLCEAFADCGRDIRHLEPHHIVELRNQWSDKPRTANAYRNLASLIFAFACQHKESGIRHNPVREVPKVKTAKRKRYLSDAEYVAIRDALMWAPPLRQFSDEFKRDAVAMCATKSRAHVARELGVEPINLDAWSRTVAAGKPFGKSYGGKKPRKLATGDVMQCAWDLAYLTMQRLKDVFAINPQTDIVDAGENPVAWDAKLGNFIRFLPSKTKHSTGDAMLFPITPQVNAVLDRAYALKRGYGEVLPCGKRSRRVRIANPFLLFHTFRGQPYKRNQVAKCVREARERAGVEDATFRDLRPKATKDAKRQGYRPDQLQTALVHASVTTTEGYMRGIGAEVSPVVLPLPKARKQ